MEEPPPTAPSTDPPPTAAAPPLTNPPSQPPSEVTPASSSSPSTAAASPSLNPVQNSPIPPQTQLLQQQQRPPLAGIRNQSPRPPQPSLPFSSFGPSRPFSQTFTPAPRNSVGVAEKSSMSNTQVRQSVQGIQKVGMTNSLSAASQVQLSGVSGYHQQILGQSPLRPASPSTNQTLSSQKIHGHGLLRAPAMASSSSPSTVPPSPQPLQQPLMSAQARQMASSLPSSSYRPQVTPQVTQQRSHLLQQHQHSLPSTSHQRQITSSQQQQQQHQQQQKHQQLQLHQRSQQQQASSPHQLQEHHNQLYLSHKSQQSVHQQQQGARTQGLTAQRSAIPALVQSGAITPTVTVDAAESGNRIISKRSIRELVTQIDPSEKLDPEVEDVLVEIGDDFIESITMFACSLAKHRKSTTLEAKDIHLHVDRNWNMTLPGFGGDEIKCYKKQLTNDIHKERLTVIKKSMIGTNEAGNMKNPPVGQAVTNIKAHAGKAPAPVSPKTGEPP